VQEPGHDPMGDSIAVTRAFWKSSQAILSRKIRHHCRLNLHATFPFWAVCYRLPSRSRAPSFEASNEFLDVQMPRCHCNWYRSQRDGHS